MSKTYDVAVVGATGAVGETMLSILEERGFPVGQIYPLASSRSAGSKISFRGREVTVGDLATFDFGRAQIGLFSAGGSVSAEYAPKAAAAGCVVIDNTAHFRYDDDIPLVVPEVNPHAIAQYKTRGIIANPNCSTIQLVVALNPLHKKAKIKRVVVSTYQSVSGAGQKGIEELSQQVRDLFSFKGVTTAAFPHQIAFNCIPQIDVFEADGYTKEEKKMINETRKIMEAPAIEVSPTCVRVPVFYGHSESVNIEFENAVTPEEAREILKSAPGVTVVDDTANRLYPLAIEAAGKDDTFVGRIRRDPAVKHGLAMWIVSDNIRKGAALNAVQIAEELVKQKLI